MMSPDDEQDKLALLSDYLGRRLPEVTVEYQAPPELHEYRLFVKRQDGAVYHVHVSEELLDSGEWSSSLISRQLEDWDPGIDPDIRLTPWGRESLFLADGVR